MDRLGKSLTLCLVVILAFSIMLIVVPTEAQSIPKPAVPEFTLMLADHSYDVPSKTTSTFNPYNNQTTIITIPGYHVQKVTIDITIKNQPFPSSIDGNKSYLLFYVRTKGHYGNEWAYPYGDAINSYPVQSNSDFTVLSLPTSYGVTSPYGENTEDLHVGDEIDFQVKAILAYGFNYSISPFFPMYSYNYESVAASDWSNTQTITIPATINLSPSPSVPEFPITLSLVIILTFVSLLLVLGKKKIAIGNMH